VRQRIERVSRKLAALRQVRELYPFDTLMLGAEQRGFNQNRKQHIQALSNGLFEASAVPAAKNDATFPARCDPMPKRTTKPPACGRL
jgi:hypothetical protein